MSGFITSIPNLQALTFRDAMREISPRWLKRGLAEKILYSIGIHLDVIGSAASEGVKKRFPLLLNSIDALEATGRSRKIARGLNELEGVYAARLLRWLDDHRTRGGPYAMLNQLLVFWAAAPGTMDLVYESGKRFHMAIGGEITESIGDAWDAATDQWARWWLVMVSPFGFDVDGLWSDPGTWDDGGTWDTSLTVDQIADLRLVPNAWNAAHPIGYITLRAAEGIELWDIPAGIWDDGGVWADSGDGNVLTFAVA